MSFSTLHLGDRFHAIAEWVVGLGRYVGLGEKHMVAIVPGCRKPLACHSPFAQMDLENTALIM